MIQLYNPVDFFEPSPLNNLKDLRKQSLSYYSTFRGHIGASPRESMFQELSTHFYEVFSSGLISLKSRNLWNDFDSYFRNTSYFSMPQNSFFPEPSSYDLKRCHEVLDSLIDDMS